MLLFRGGFEWAQPSDLFKPFFDLMEKVKSKQQFLK